MSRTPPTTPQLPNPYGSMPVDRGPATLGDGPIGEGVTCVNCGYSLMGLHPSGVCPECGTPCEHALRGNLLLFAGESYFASLRLGVSLILNAILLLVILVIAGVAVVLAMRTTPAAGTAQFAITAATFVVNAIFLYGWWKFSEPDPGYIGQRTGADARQVVRLATIAMAAISLLDLVVEMLVYSGPIAGAGWLPVAMMGLGLMNIVASTVQFFAGMLYVKWLAPRLPNLVVYTRAKRYMWLLPVLNTVGLILLGLGPVIALVMYWNHLDLVRKDLKRLAGERSRLGAPGVR